MEQNRMENDTGRARSAYVPPLTEVYATEPNSLLAGTDGVFSGGAGGGSSDDNDGGGAGSGTGENNGLDGGLGAKAMILGQEFSFSNMWEE